MRVRRGRTHRSRSLPLKKTAFVMVTFTFNARIAMTTVTTRDSVAAVVGWSLHSITTRTKRGQGGTFMLPGRLQSTAHQPRVSSPAGATASVQSSPSSPSSSIPIALHTNVDTMAFFLGGIVQNPPSIATTTDTTIILVRCCPCRSVAPTAPSGQRRRSSLCIQGSDGHRQA